MITTAKTHENQARQILLGSIEQIPPGEGREFDVEGRLITVFRPRGGGIYATQARCPHKQGPLADGLLGGTTVICPYHAWKFDIASGQPLPTNPGEGCLRTYPVALTENGEIWLTLTQSESDPLKESEGCTASS